MLLHSVNTNISLKIISTVNTREALLQKDLHQIISRDSQEIVDGLSNNEITAYAFFDLEKASDKISANSRQHRTHV